jgi:CheY-like chemotaxis protein
LLAFEDALSGSCRAPSSGAGTNGLVLVVDDDDDVRSVLVDVLSTEGYEVIAARNGREALRVAASARPALIILDLMMPVMSGWEFLVHQRADPRLAEIPVLAMSASHAITLEVGRFMAKPMELNALFAAVRELVPARHSRVGS